MVDYTTFEYKKTLVTDIENHISGLLTISDDSDEYDSFYSLNNGHVTVIPFSECARETVDNCCASLGENGFCNKWFFGISDMNTMVAIFCNQPMSQTRSQYNDLHSGKFWSPVYIQASSSEISNTQKFDCIEFYGGVVDLVYEPFMAFETGLEGGVIKYRSASDYTRVFDIQIGVDKFRIVIGIYSDKISGIEVPDIKKNTHSALRFVFEELQDVKYIEKYYGYAMSLFQFCVGRLNIRFDIRIYNYTISVNPMYVRLIDGYTDCSNTRLNSHRVISFTHLGEKLPRLLNLLNNKKKKPYLEFLPSQNKYEVLLSYIQVNDICISFEREYELLMRDLVRNENYEIAACELSSRILDFLEKDDAPDIVKKKAESIISSNLKNFTPSLSEKISCIFKRYKEETCQITDFYLCDESIKGNSYIIKQDIENKIKLFKRIRDTASHAGVKWNGGQDIFPYLKLLIYYSVMERAGFDDSERTRILGNLFIHEF